MAKPAGRIVVAAGTNGAGKTSIAAAWMAKRDLDYFNPDAFAEELATFGKSRDEANVAAWRTGYDALRRAVDRDGNFAFETTLGGDSIVRELHRAIDLRREVHVIYVGLDSPDLHVARVSARVARGGHAVPEAMIRRRYNKSLANLVSLIGKVTSVHLFDNSTESLDGTPRARLVFRMRGKNLVAPDLSELLTSTPEWAKPLAAAAIEASASLSRRRKVR